MPDTPRTVVVASTVMLSFISFWRAAAIVLSDLASSAYYAGGIAESSIGKSAPWFILAIMLFGFAIRAIYVESSSMFVRGGVYKVVREAMGGTLAKISVSALMFDYVLTGPISGVSAGLYLAGLINEGAGYLQQPWRVPAPAFAAGFALLVTIYFWHENRIGIRESSAKALRIVQVTTVMVVILIGWSLVTVSVRGFQPVPLPTKTTLHFGPEALGWLDGTAAPSITAVAILIGLGHSLLAMSGFETLAQIYRDLEAPKLKNLQRTGLIVILYSLVFTSSVSFFSVMLIPDSVRPRYLDNLIGGLSMFLAGPPGLRLGFHAFVVLVGTLILSGAVNTAIIGSNGVLNRVAEDGVLPDWFRQPHPAYGTTSRVINVVAALQILAIVLSRGNVNLLGEAYAFGVVWSFAMKALSVLVLRFRRAEAPAWKVPLNVRFGATEVPLGLILITLSLFLLAIVNVLTKKTATISGSLFTMAFFLVFSMAERKNRAKGRSPAVQEKFRLEERPELSPAGLQVRPGNVLVAVSRPDHLEHLERVLNEVSPAKQDIVAVVVHRLPPLASGEHELEPKQFLAAREAELLSKVVTVAEQAGKPVKLLVIPGTDVWFALVHAARQLGSARIVASRSPKVSPEEQSQQMGRAWEQLPDPRPPLTFQIVPGRDGEPAVFALGPHPPSLWPGDIDLVHHLWRELTEQHGLGPHLHHRDVVGAALRHLDEELHSGDAARVIEEVRREIASGRPGPSS